MHAYLDIFVFVVALLFGFTGAKRGLIRELFRLAAMIIGLFSAFLYYKDVQKHIEFLNFPSQISSLLAFLAVFIFAALIILGTGLLVRKITHLTPLGWLDRLSGVIIGLFKTALIAWVACLSLSSVPNPNTREQLRKSTTFRIYEKLPEKMSLK